MGNLWPDLIIGIDLGTTGTSVAYAKTTDDDVKVFRKWPNDVGAGQSAKVPSIVTVQGQCASHWGFSVFQLDPEMLFSCEICKLFKQQFDCNDSQIVTEAEHAMQLYFGELLHYLETELGSHLPVKKTWSKSCIRFVFSCPTTWDKETRERFAGVIERAGFSSGKDHSFDVTLDEAEASILYFMQDVSRKDRPRPGEIIFLADIGGGTADVAIFKVTSVDGHNAKLELKVSGRGSYTGATQIDEAFRALLRLKLEPLFRKSLEEVQGHLEGPLSETQEGALTELIEAAVFTLDQRPDYVNQKHIYGSPTANGKLQKKKFFKLHFEDLPSLAAENGGSGFWIEADKDEFFQAAFVEQCEAIWDTCVEQIDRFDGEHIDRIVLSGGFSQSPFVRKELAERFLSHPLSKKAPMVYINDYQVAVSKALVHDELRLTYGTSNWVYPAEASYGIQQGSKKSAVTKWFVHNGERLKVPQVLQTKHSLPIDLGKPTGDPEFSVVINKADRVSNTPFNREEKERWLDSVRTRKDISDWVKISLPMQMRSRNRFFSKNEAEVVITAKMSRNVIVLAMECNGVQSNNEPLVLEERWHNAPESRRGQAPSPKRWKFGKREARVLGSILMGVVGIIAMVFGGVDAFGLAAVGGSSGGPRKGGSGAGAGSREAEEGDEGDGEDAAAE